MVVISFSGKGKECRLAYRLFSGIRPVSYTHLGGWVENGEYPADDAVLEKIIKGISYNNAVRYFDFGEL